MRRWALRALAVIVALPLGLSASPFSPPRAAHACGVFADPEKQPSLAHEQVLLIHDAARGRQHFIRKITFRDATRPFGFVVPTPSRPEVVEVQASPFAALARSFVFGAPKHDKAHGRLGGGVQVLEVQEVGSFTAFVLRASDLSALRAWFEDNGFASTRGGDEWLAHYSNTRFHYVALRYNPKASSTEGSRSVRAETLRISFDTPLPYYPYLEPQVPAGVERKRLLELWLVTSALVVPVALREGAGEGRWVRPLKPGLRVERAREILEGILEPELEALLPTGEIHVQTFQDQKRSRAGFFDILFVPVEKRRLSQEDIGALAPLMPILDPKLAGVGWE